MIRELINRFNRSLSEQMVSPRRKHTAPVKVWFDPDSNTERAREIARNSCILGETIDVSKTGVGFLVPSIRDKEKYLVGQDRMLNIEIDSPSGKIFLRAKGRRYEKVGIHLSMERYLIGVEITELVGSDLEAYESLLVRRSPRAPKSTGEIRVPAA